MKDLYPLPRRPQGRPAGRNYPANIHVSVTVEQREKVDQICKRRHIKPSDLIRELIDNA